MYKQLTTLILALLLSSSLYAQQLYVGTYNIRYNNPNDEHEERMGTTLSTIMRFH